MSLGFHELCIAQSYPKVTDTNELLGRHLQVEVEILLGTQKTGYCLKDIMFIINHHGLCNVYCICMCRRQKSHVQEPSSAHASCFLIIDRHLQEKFMLSVSKLLALCM